MFLIPLGQERQQGQTTAVNLMALFSVSDHEGEVGWWLDHCMRAVIHSPSGSI